MRIPILITGMALVLGCTQCSKAIIDENPTDLPPVNQPVHYQPEVQTIMFNNCITCHSGAAPSAGLRLDNYGDTRYATEYGKLIDRINNASNPMPPSGLLPAATRQLMDKWVVDGYPEK
jgi:cytochrome c5